jgi:ATPase subunit of ABC transporter with duplicated ATPase domains
VGTVERIGEIGYLPQDPRSGDPEELAKNRILNARGLGSILMELEQTALDMGSVDEAVYDKAMRRYSVLEEQFQASGGYAAEAQAAAIASNLGLKEHILAQPLKTLSGGQRRRIELARILFSNAETMILDEPTNHLDADSVIWLRDFLKSYPGGLIVISHDVDLIGETVNRIFYLDAMRGVIDVYNMGWRNYLKQRESDEERRKRERANAEKKASTLQLQAARLDGIANAAEQVLRHPRFGDELVNAGFVDTRDDVLRIGVAADDDAHHVGPLVAHVLEKLYPGGDGHALVAQDHVDLMALQQCAGVRGAGGSQHRVVFVEVAADGVERAGFVVDDQDAG